MDTRMKTETLMRIATDMAHRYVKEGHLYGDSRRRMVLLQKQAEDVSRVIRGSKTEYEMFLYQALGRKVDFEEVSVEKSTGAQCNVIARYLVQKTGTEPLAPRFFIDAVVTPLDTEFTQECAVTVNAGFINAIGMKQIKFTQDGFNLEKLAIPTDVFGWIEYLEGDFLRAKRLVRPFGGGEMDMGTLDPL